MRRWNIEKILEFQRAYPLNHRRFQLSILIQERGHFRKIELPGRDLSKNVIEKFIVAQRNDEQVVRIARQQTNRSTRLRRFFFEKARSEEQCRGSTAKV